MKWWTIQNAIWAIRKRNETKNLFGGHVLKRILYIWWHVIWDTRVRIFFNSELILSGYGFRPHASGESGIWIRSPEWKFLNTLWIRNRVDAKSGYFFIRWRDKIEPSSLPWILYSRWQPHSQVVSLTRTRRSKRGPWERGCSRWLPPYDACSVVNIPRGVLGTRVDG